ncbi:RNA deprotection pyrophosphohydrolase [Bacillus massiliglaciei]|uniref:RNA deprotection pyrophosphohydrolase n=1 Tax=Bacillus massiliglaciei TaxID=1816693 RepID=UPI000DA5FF03|nr:nucleoside triphosphatase YtkD [Bacillus massiliglaciei]
MEIFKDINENKVEFSADPIFGAAGHVFALCRLGEKWVLTRHKKRGVEFPGGKREKGETEKQAAEREIYEETGGIVKHLSFIGQYKVYDQRPFVKSVFFAELLRLEKKDEYLETDGPVLMKSLPENIRDHAEFSFIMKDQVVPLSLEQWKKQTAFERTNGQL